MKGIRETKQEAKIQIFIDTENTQDEHQIIRKHIEHFWTNTRGSVKVFKENQIQMEQRQVIV